MGRRAALMIGTALLALGVSPTVRAQTADVIPGATYQIGQPPPDMPAEDGARMAQLELEATAAIEAGDWPAVERLLREGLALEQRHYAPDDARIGHSWGWLARAAMEQGRPAAEVIPMAETRLWIAQAHPEDAATLAAALHLMGDQLLSAGRADEAVPMLRQAQGLLAARGDEARGDLRVTHVRLGMALTQTGAKPEAAELLTGVLADLTADAAADPGDTAYVAWEAAVVLYDLDRYAEAAPPFQTVFRHRGAIGAARDEAVAGYWLADTLIRLDQIEAADAVMARVVAVEQAAAPDQRALSPQQVREAVAAHGDRMRSQRRYDLAEAAYRHLVVINREQADAPLMTAGSLSRLGLVQQQAGRYAEAATAQREALALWQAQLNAPHASIATQQEQLGRTLLLDNVHVEAQPLLGEARLMRQALGEEVRIDVLMDLAEVAEQLEMLQTARERREEILTRLRAQAELQPDQLADALSSLAYVHYLLDNHVEAERLYREALGLTQHVRLTQRIKAGLAVALTAQGQGAEGEAFQRQALAEAVAAEGPESTAAAAAMSDLARILTVRRDAARAEPLLRDSLAILEAQAEPDRARIATTKLNLGVVMSDMERPQDALRLYNEAFAIRRELFGAGHARTVAVIELILFEYVALGAYDLAEPLAARMARLRQDQVGSDHPILAEALQRHAYVLQNAGRTVEAERLMRRAADIMQRHSQDPRERIRYDANWGVTLLTSDRPAEAMQVFRRAEAGLVERRRTASDPSWSRNEAESFRFLHRFAVQAAWKAAAATAAP